MWEQATAAIVAACEELQLPYVIEEGEAAFYGAKLDFMVRDVLKREWQLGTIQVDYNLPERFELEYVDAHNERQRPHHDPPRPLRQHGTLPGHPDRAFRR